jgi:hypothetical protein
MVASGAGLASWNDTPARESIVTFVESVVDRIPPEQRIAVFDNDGTLWSEKPMPVELVFILQRLTEMAEADPALRDRQPWKASYDKDYAWLASVMDKHYEGDDSLVKLLMVGLLQAFAGWTVEEYGTAADRFVGGGTHPTLGRPFSQCGYAPMVELLRYLEANEFVTFIASGGNRDFMRGFAQSVYDIPPERIIGSSNALEYHHDDHHGGSVVYLDQPDVFDDGPAKPVRIWSRIGRRPIIAGGNSNGDVPMLRFAGGPDLPALRLLVLHDDPDREVAYTTGAEGALEHARQHGWTVVSMKDDWSRVFTDA